MSAKEIAQFKEVQDRARKSKQKVDIYIGYEDYYAIGPNAVADLKKHLNKYELTDKCKVFTYKTLREVEAHLNAVEFCISMLK